MDANFLAPWYRWIEYVAFGRALERSRFVFLHRAAHARRVLILGEGDGRVLERLLRIAPRAQFDVIESSAAMIDLARRRIGRSSRVDFRHGNALDIGLPVAEYDAVVACFFLDCFTEDELHSLLRRVAPALLPGAMWLISEFAIPAKGWRRWHARAWIGTMYRFFNISTGLRARTLPPIGKMLQDAGVVRLDCRPWRWGLIESEVLAYRPDACQRKMDLARSA
jgi:ubiquinone/menaquinone biosynthesis C-methylase UbiE